MLKCRNNGVKDVAYKCYASITLGGAEGGAVGMATPRQLQDPQ